VSNGNRTSGRSRLYYFGTREEVRLGDRIRIKRLFRKDLVGTVCYIPGISPRHSVLESDDGAVRQWAYELEDGMIMVVAYFPDHLQPRPNVQLISRGEEKSISPDTALL